MQDKRWIVTINKTINNKTRFVTGLIYWNVWDHFSIQTKITRIDKEKVTESEQNFEHFYLNA